MISSSRSPARVIVVLLVFVLLLMGAQTVAVQADPGSDGGITLKVLDVTPTSVGPDDTVTAQVELTNSSSQDLDDVEVNLSIARYKLSSDMILANWFSGAEQIVTPLQLDSVRLDEPLEAGESRKVTLSTPASDLRLLPYPDAAGPRGLIITATDPQSRIELDAVRTFLLWFPNDEIEPLRLTILSPVTGPAPTPLEPDAWGQRIADATNPAGRLSALLAVTAAHKDVTWVVDPALIDAAANGTAGDSGTMWFEDFSRAATGREIFALDAFDPDISALSAAEIDLSTITATQRESASGWRDDLTLPATGVVDQDMLLSAVEADRPIVVMNEGLLPLPSSEPAQSAAALVTTDRGTATTLLPNAELSRLFENPSSAGLNSTFEARQLLLARLAVISQQNPSEAQHVLLTTDRNWNPDVDNLRAVMDGLAEARFIETEPLSRLLGARITAAPLEAVPTTAIPSPTQVTRQDLSGLLTQAEQISILSQVATDPEAFDADFRAGLAAATSTAWRNDPQGRSKALSDLSAYADTFRNRLSIVPGSNLNLISDRGDLPVTLRNDFDQDLTVDVALVPDNRRLSIEDTFTVTIPAESAVSVNIPATAIGSGDVTVEVQVLTPDGTHIATPSHFTVRVRADWENLGTAILAAGLAIALAFGVIRTIKRGKRPTRMEPIHPAAPQSTP